MIKLGLIQNFACKIVPAVVWSFHLEISILSRRASSDLTSRGLKFWTVSAVIFFAFSIEEIVKSRPTWVSDIFNLRRSTGSSSTSTRPLSINLAITPLVVAAQNGGQHSSDFLKLLIGAGADIEGSADKRECLPDRGFITWANALAGESGVLLSKRFKQQSRKHARFY